MLLIFGLFGWSDKIYNLKKSPNIQDFLTFTDKQNRENNEQIKG